MKQKLYISIKTGIGYHEQDNSMSLDMANTIEPEDTETMLQSGQWVKSGENNAFTIYNRKNKKYHMPHNKPALHIEHYIYIGIHELGNGEKYLEGTNEQGGITRFLDPIYFRKWSKTPVPGDKITLVSPRHPEEGYIMAHTKVLINDIEVYNNTK